MQAAALFIADFSLFSLVIGFLLHLHLHPPLHFSSILTRDWQATTTTTETAAAFRRQMADGAAPFPTAVSQWNRAVAVTRWDVQANGKRVRECERVSEEQQYKKTVCVSTAEL